MFNSLLSKNKVKNLSADLFERKISENAENILIDVRTKEEFVELRLPNSILIDIYQPDFFEKIEKLDKSKTYYVYCRSGSRSYTACQQMISMGFANLYNLENGIINWEGETENG